MKILYLGDVMGRSGRQAISNELPDLRARLKADFVVVNGENATGGMGLSGNHAQEILKAGADCITLGDHAFDQKDMLQFIETEPRIIRPLNFSKSAPGRGAAIFTATRGRKVLVAQVLGQVFMKRPFDDPFSAVDAILSRHPLGGQVAAIVRPPLKKWRWGIFAMARPVWLWARTPMCPRPMRRFWNAARAFKAMPACAVITTPLSVCKRPSRCAVLSLACPRRGLSRLWDRRLSAVFWLKRRSPLARPNPSR